MATAKQAGGTAVAPKPPSGMQKLITGHEGWVAFVQNRPIYGTLVGFQKRSDGEGYEYLLRLLQPAVGKRTDDKGEVDFFEHPEGAIVAMNEQHQIGNARRPGLREYVESGAKVWINPLGKSKLSGGRTVWDLDIQIQGRKGPLPAVLRGDANEEGGDNIPF